MMHQNHRRREHRETGRETERDSREMRKERCAIDSRGGFLFYSGLDGQDRPKTIVSNGWGKAKIEDLIKYPKHRFSGENMLFDAESQSIYF
jgi:hypothetical protein